VQVKPPGLGAKKKNSEKMDPAKGGSCQRRKRGGRCAAGATHFQQGTDACEKKKNGRMRGGGKRKGVGALGDETNQGGNRLKKKGENTGSTRKTPGTAPKDPAGKGRKEKKEILRGRKKKTTPKSWSESKTASSNWRTLQRLFI